MLNKEIFVKNYDFIDNIFLDSYIELLEKNINQKKLKFQTQQHHIIPVAYYKNKFNIKDRNLAIIEADKDNNNFVVNLLYKDHVLAHYYLALCTKGKLKYQNESAIFHVLGNINYIKSADYLSDYQAIINLNKYQEIYVNMSQTRSENYKGKHCKPNTELHKQQISAKNSGATYVRKFIANTWVSKKVHSAKEFQEAIEEGWEKGNIPRDSCNANVGELISNAKKGKICINDGFKNKYIDDKDLQLYLENGWKKGSRKINIRERVLISKFNAVKNIYLDQLTEYEKKGWEKIDNRQ